MTDALFQVPYWHIQNTKEKKKKKNGGTWKRQSISFQDIRHTDALFQILEVFHIFSKFNWACEDEEDEYVKGAEPFGLTSSVRFSTSF